MKRPTYLFRELSHDAQMNVLRLFQTEPRYEDLDEATKKLCLDHWNKNELNRFLEDGRMP